MIDYKSIQALKTVIELQSFDSAAEKLCITQSAVSQRIKSLEINFGAPVLIRMLPYKVTKLGQNLLSHLAKVEWLESDLLQGKHLRQDINLHMSIAINQDSLDTWFIDVLDEIKDHEIIRFKLKTTDQEMTHSLLQKGEVLACVSTMEKAYNGCDIQALGEINYFLVCSPDFYNQHFRKLKKFSNSWLKILKEAPSLLFNQYDQLNSRFMEKFYSFQINPDNCHVIPSVKAFKQLCLQGKGYALLPKSDILMEINNNKLIILDERSTWTMPLYWHYWNLPDERYQEINSKIISISKQKLLKIKHHPF